MRIGRTPVDITGKRYGRLVAIKMVGTKKGHAQWLCKCDCGNEHITTLNCLKGGNVSSCGCIVDEIKKNREESIVGRKFGRLTVLEKAESKNNKSFWKCRCDCGNIVVVTRGNLSVGTTKSCGCLADEFRRNKEIKHRKYNNFEIKENVVYIDVDNPRFQGRKIICDIDIWNEKLKEYYWFVDGHGYARTSTTRRGKELFMHKLVSGTDGSEITDHINQNRLDNRKENLRTTNQSMNAFNRKVRKDSKSGYNGVWKDKKSGKWKAGICIDGKRNHLGYFYKLEDAINARKEAEIKYRGELSEKE